MKPKLLVDGFPKLKADGSEFTEVDYVNIVKETCIFATKIADEVDLSDFEPNYDDRNKRRKLTLPEPVKFSEVLSSKTKTADPTTSTEPALGEEEDVVRVEDFS